MLRGAELLLCRRSTNTFSSWLDDSMKHSCVAILEVSPHRSVHSLNEVVSRCLSEQSTPWFLSRCNFFFWTAHQYISLKSRDHRCEPQSHRDGLDISNSAKRKCTWTIITICPYIHVLRVLGKEKQILAFVPEQVSVDGDSDQLRG